MDKARIYIHLRGFMALALLTGTAALLLSAPARSAEVEGVDVPERVRLAAGAPELVLNGAGVRVRFVFFRVYVAALYLPARTSDAEAILRDSGPSRLFIQMLRDVATEQLTSLMNEALQETLTPEERLPLEARLKRFNAIFDTLPEAKAGTQITIDYLPQPGTVIRVNGEEKGRIPGADFNRALLRIWIGERPRDPELKKAMLGSSGGR